MQIIQSGIDVHVSVHKRGSHKPACTDTNLHALAYMHQNALAVLQNVHTSQCSVALLLCVS